MYVDDLGGAEETEEKAKESFEEMGNLLKELGLEETAEKAEGNIWKRCKSVFDENRSNPRDDLLRDHLQHEGGDHKGGTDPLLKSFFDVLRLTTQCCRG